MESATFAARVSLIRSIVVAGSGAHTRIAMLSINIGTAEANLYTFDKRHGVGE
jgi:hypothetical protein